MSLPLTRRHALLAGTALPFAATTTLPTTATAQSGGAMLPTHRDFLLGDFRVTTLLAGSRLMENPQAIFGLNVPADEFAAVSRANFIDPALGRNFFTPTVVNTGREVILFDTGLDAGGITAALAAAGYVPADITHVVITHMHGDHIGGLSDAQGMPTFANAAYVAGAVEYDYWAGAGNDGFEAKVRPLGAAMTMIGDGDTVRSGITAIAAPGHTPGHMAFMLESAGAQMLLMVDTANHHVWSLAHPDWEVRFDADKSTAAATRRRILGMVAADRIAVIGYHMPFPGAGFVETRGDGFHYVPVSTQFY